MKIKFVFTLFLFLTMKGVDAQLTLSQARMSYLSLADDKCKALELSKKFDKYPPSDALMKAYYGASLAAAPECLNNPLDKLKYFRRGKQFLDEAVKLDPTQVEIRFLRFATQTKAPSFLGYSGNIDEDKKTIFRFFVSYAKLEDNREMSRQITRFLINSGKLTADEQAGLTAYIN